MVCCRAGIILSFAQQVSTVAFVGSRVSHGAAGSHCQTPYPKGDKKRRMVVDRELDGEKLF